MGVYEPFVVENLALHILGHLQDTACVSLMQHCPNGGWTTPPPKFGPGLLMLDISQQRTADITLPSASAHLLTALNEFYGHLLASGQVDG